MQCLHGLLATLLSNGFLLLVNGGGVEVSAAILPSSALMCSKRSFAQVGGASGAAGRTLNTPAPGAALLRRVREAVILVTKVVMARNEV